eukprot:CAMPEP_0114249646 /NCGR_PEP_ID=MMETSP0058-20121206/14261_1 /TAXON_ID=36894 /ORGANISM="Pyramimonas parkeae, CCMP726" /LENGTH=298 /DNA_ID=CAMNT_0001363221 /DNA_START=187 /DNA_END=1080 /DNA_ORIENTATION=-
MAIDRLGSGSNCCRDRTSEFFAIAERLRKQQGKPAGLGVGLEGGINGDHGMPGPSNEGKSEFARRAARVGHGIHGTAAKLSKLAQLAKRTSIFDDPAQEIAELTTIIKQDISTLNGAITELQNFSHQAGSGYSNNKQNVEHSSTVVNNLKSRLMNATKEFKEVLTIRTENLKAHDNRRGLFSKEPRPGSGGSGHKPLFGASAGKEAHSPSGASGALGGSQQMAMVQPNVQQSRAQALQNVESTIAELGGIFQQLATMVAEQGEMAIRIDENLDETLSNVDLAQTHLLKYLNRISSNRW